MYKNILHEMNNLCNVSTILQSLHIDTEGMYILIYIVTKTFYVIPQQYVKHRSHISKTLGEKAFIAEKSIAAVFVFFFHLTLILCRIGILTQHILMYIIT